MRYFSWIRQSVPFPKGWWMIAMVVFVVGKLQAQQYQFKNYSLTEGLAQSQVYAMLEDHRGYIWMGTRGGGISRYNGLEFNTYSKQNGLKDNYILCMYEDRKNRIWIGSNTGVTLYENDEFKTIRLYLGDVEVECIHEDTNGTIWLGTKYGLLFCNNTEGTYSNNSNLKEKPKTKANLGFEFERLEITGFNNSRVNFIEPDSTGNLWIGTNLGIFVIGQKGTLIQRFGKKSRIKSTQIRCMETDKMGAKWVGTYGYGLFRMTGEHYHDIDLLENVKDFKSLNDAIVSSILCDSKGRMWISTLKDGVCIFNPSDSTTIFLSEKDGLANHNVKTVLEDQWGNYWIGTSGGGVSKYSGQQFEAFTTRSGLAGNYIYSIYFDLRGKMWIGTSGGGIEYQDSTGYVHFNADSGFTNAKVKTVYQDQDSVYWFGTEGKGLYSYDGDTFRLFNNNDGLGGIWIKDIIPGNNGELWVASSSGGVTKITQNEPTILDSSIIRNYTFKKYQIRDGMISNRIICLYKDDAGRIWYASQTSGLGYIFNDDEFAGFSYKDGLAGNNVRSITGDRFGNIWAGSSTGLSVIDSRAENMQESIRSYTVEDGLSSANIYLTITDEDDNLWIGTEKGVDRIKIDSGGNLLDIKHFGKDDGFTGVEANQNVCARDSAGNVWFGTINGMYKYLSQVNIKNEQPPILNFTGISMNFDPIPSQKWDSLVFDYDQNRISFEFQGITQTLPKKIRYKYILRGLEEDWSPPSYKNSVTFSNLDPGTYTFKVLSCNENDIWNQQPISVSFEITPPIWMEAWFQGTGVSGFLLIIGLVVSLRIQTIRKKERAKQEKLQLERDLISVEQKALRLQMNPHFIFNSLNSIQSLIASGDELGARKNLSGFAKLMRQILENSRKNKITLEEEISTLRNYLTIEKDCNEGKFDFDFEVSPDLEVELIEIPPMIIQPFVENAIKHGMSERGEDGKIIIRFFLDHETLLHCIVQDNGIGRKRAAEKKKDSKSTHKSTALDVTEERLGLLEQATGSIEIKDLVGENGEALGTEVHVKIPIVS